MFAALRKRLTYANVVSSISLFLLLGGGAYAATRLQRNSVGTKQLKDNAVISSKVKDRSLLAKDFMNGQLPRGPRGDRGDRGNVGPSDGYGISQANPSSCNGFACVASLTLPNLPAGSYAISAKVRADARNYSGTFSTKVTCTLVAGADSDEADVNLGETGASGADLRLGTLPLQLVHTFDAAGSVALHCQSDASAPSVEYADARITAVKLGHVSSLVVP